jgi:predicted nicotinamide N-methyase
VQAAADLVEETVVLGNDDLTILRPRNGEALLDEEAFEREEYLPYWAELWPSGVALARAVAARTLRGARTLELGCGLGLASTAAARAGGRVLATDWSPDAIRLTEANAERNAVTVETALCSWAEPAALVERGPWDLVLASDVLYERRNVDLLLDLLPRLVAPAGEAWVADPDRPPAARFVERAAADWELRSVSAAERPRVTIHRLRKAAGRRPGRGPSGFS